ncbi:hypothetical protein BST38_09500 [Mycolicibacterium parafortuitum]|nr:hypothetical protein [Mycolicibacterium parafortuitum]ORB30524.1 hypothetical protein BST38_09500 [Mycolicibacterium parafortuitum]
MEWWSVAIFDRLSIRAAAVGAGMCCVALGLSPAVAQAGGAECLQNSAGVDPAAATVCAPITEMAGVPMALPGPLAPPPVVPPIAPPPPPAAPLVPLAGAAADGLPLSSMGGLAGKGDLTGPAPSGAPLPGQPIMPGPGNSTGH